jgi:hypothetical protein
MVLESKLRVALAAIAVCVCGAGHVRAQSPVTTKNSKVPPMSIPGKLYCNLKALTANERNAHKQLTEKLASARKKVVETEKGYQFQFNPSAVSISELAQWVTNESKCCPFFNFQIDVKSEGTVLRLRLSGDEGVKAFIRAEFQL